MSQIKIRINSNNYSIKLEGNANLVNKYFEEFKTNGFPLLELAKNTVSEPLLNSKTAKLDSPSPENGDVEFPVLLRDVVMRQLPGPESEWILVYAYYSSNNFTKPFTKEEIVSSYKNPNRWTTSNRKNFAKNFSKTIDNLWFRSLGPNEFVFLEEGKKKVQEIMTRTKSGKKKLAPKKKIDGVGPITNPKD